MTKYDIAIIGSGPGGYVAGLYASRHDQKVCIIEKGLVGGTCLNRGCIPTKVMLNSASILSEIKGSAKYGIISDNIKVDFPKVASRKDEVVLKLRTGIETLLRANKIDLIRGAAQLKDRNTVTAGGMDYGAKNIIIATGSSPAELPGAGFDERDILSSDGILGLKSLPKSLVIVGGGAIGCEFADIFNSFGTKVVMVELTDRLIPTQSREVSKKLELIFKKKGIEVLTSTKIESISKKDTLKAKLSSGKDIEAEKILISVGRRADTDNIGLENAGIKMEKRMIAVDDRLRTNADNIYAIGDCVRGPLLAHKASYDGVVAVDNILGHERHVDYSNVPSCIYTDPEIASVGISEDTVKAERMDAKVAKFPYLASGKAYLMGKSEGYIKIIGDSEGKILGIEIMGEEACDLIGEGVLAKTVGVNIKELSRVVHAHPTLSEIFQEAAHIFCGTPIHSV